MNLEKALLQEHSKKLANRIVNYEGADRERFAELIKLFLSGEYRLTQRAAWPLSYCVQFHPSLVGPHLNKLVKQLYRSDVHNAVTRNIIRLFQFIEIPVR